MSTIGFTICVTGTWIILLTYVSCLGRANLQDLVD